jgi:hypothetical protein
MVRRKSPAVSLGAAGLGQGIAGTEVKVYYFKPRKRAISVADDSRVHPRLGPERTGQLMKHFIGIGKEIIYQTAQAIAGELEGMGYSSDRLLVEVADRLSQNVGTSSRQRLSGQSPSPAELLSGHVAAMHGTPLRMTQRANKSGPPILRDIVVPSHKVSKHAVVQGRLMILPEPIEPYTKEFSVPNPVSDPEDRWPLSKFVVNDPRDIAWRPPPSTQEAAIAQDTYHPSLWPALGPDEYAEGTLTPDPRDAILERYQQRAADMEHARMRKLEAEVRKTQRDARLAMRKANRDLRIATSAFNTAVLGTPRPVYRGSVASTMKFALATKIRLEVMKEIRDLARNEADKKTKKSHPEQGGS